MINSSKKIYIIAEIGINHNGYLGLAKKMIIAAKRTERVVAFLEKSASRKITTIPGVKKSVNS